MYKKWNDKCIVDKEDPGVCVQMAPLTNLLFLKNVLLFLRWVLVAARWIFNLPWVMQEVFYFLFFSSSMQTLSWGMWNLVPQPGIEPAPPSLGDWSLSHWTTKKAPTNLL